MKYDDAQLEFWNYIKEKRGEDANIFKEGPKITKVTVLSRMK